MKTKRMIGISLAIIANAILLSACNQSSDATPEPAQQVDRAAEQLLERCIGQARAQNYRSGQCAYRFLEACTKTQSRNEMEAVLRADQFGKIGSTLCPNSPDVYNAAFDRF